MSNKKTPDEKRDILSAYRFWLNHLVQNEISGCYNNLLAILWRTEFYSDIEEDNDRARDALILRDMFSSENKDKLTNEEYLKLNKTSVRLIEVMIALSRRINDTVSTTNDISKYFWEMVASLELQKMDDENFIASTAQKKISIFLERRYHKNGRGSLFFIKGIGPEYNATITPLWMQMNVYLNYMRGDKN